MPNCNTSKREQCSGKARAFLGRQAAHSEDHNEEKLRKMGESDQRMRKNKECFSLAHLRLRIWLCPVPVLAGGWGGEVTCISNHPC